MYILWLHSRQSCIITVILILFVKTIALLLLHPPVDKTDTCKHTQSEMEICNHLVELKKVAMEGFWSRDPMIILRDKLFPLCVVSYNPAECLPHLCWNSQTCNSPSKTGLNGMSVRVFSVCSVQVQDDSKVYRVHWPSSLASQRSDGTDNRKHLSTCAHKLA